jgi:hypothetical protein
MPLFNNPSIAIGRTKLFRFRKIEGVQEVLNQFAGGIQGIQTDAGTAKATVDEIDTSAKKAIQSVEDVVVKSSTALANIEAVGKAVLSLQANADTAKTTVGEIDTSANNAKVNVDDVAVKSSVALKDIEAIGKIASSLLIPEHFPKNRIPNLWVCERTLHRVEQLTTDKSPDKIANNRELSRILKDELTTECKEILEHSPHLVIGIDTIHNPFSGTGVNERYERFYQIQKLRREIVEYLATKTEEKQGAQVN